MWGPSLRPTQKVLGARGEGYVQPLGQFLRLDVLTAAAIGLVAATPILPWLLDWLYRRHPQEPAVPGVPVQAFASAACLALLLLSAIAVSAQTHNPFIYFRF